MKSKTILAILFLIPTYFYSQAKLDKVIFLDSLSHETMDKDYKYMRVIKDYYSEKETYSFFDYYKSGKIKTQGTTESKNSLKQTGMSIQYFESGKKRIVSNYKKGELIGSYFELYENGNKKLEAEYIEEKDKHNSLKVKSYWDKNNIQTIVNGNGFFEDNNENSYSQGRLKNGVKDSIWEGVSRMEKYRFKEKYENGKFISGSRFEENNQPFEYKELDVYPKPKKGMEDFYRYIGRKMRIPLNLGNLNGTIIIGFVIDKEGKIIETKIIRSLYKTLDDEAIRVLLSYGDWIPGEQRGKKRRCTYSIPIAIKPGLN
ncbi:MAG: energy transducer TonB [Flavobacterium sp.]|uniref:energy transducer TonB n=1 Tax=Flavobacterium sp. TaxID=239 RepID=UPI00262F9C32|nr:energy transducer TonB [Flavobacterium sp.]MDD5149706.1 energy transducer TonB [Flavobacterium sp.]